MDHVITPVADVPAHAMMNIMAGISIVINGILAWAWVDMDIIIRMTLGLMGVVSFVFSIRYHKIAARKVRKEEELLDRKLKAADDEQ
jgi:predicted membrane protein